MTSFRLLIAAAAVLTGGAMSAMPAMATCSSGVYCNSGASSYGGSAFSAAGSLSSAVSQGSTRYSFAPVTSNHSASSYAYSSYGSDYSNGASQSYQSSIPASDRLPGLAADEYLCPTTCPTAVNVPAGAKVLDCFSVCKKAPQIQTVTTAYQVVRPVVYVRYPVPVAVPSCPIYIRDSRYGPRPSSCGR